MDEKYIRNRRKLIIAGIILAAALIILAIVSAIFYAIYTAGKVQVEVKIAPFAASVKLNDQSLRNNSKNWITPGDYTVTAEFKNFETLSFEVSVDENTDSIHASLSAANAEGRKYLDDHLREFQEVEAISADKAVKEGGKQRNKWPIINKLPISDPHYVIGYTIPDDDHLVITVDASIKYRDLAISKLQETLKKDDYAKYDIRFEKLVNPYTHFVENDNKNAEKYIKAGFPKYNFTINQGQVIEGNYYCAFLRSQRDGVSEIFKIVLQKENGRWVLINTPYPILTTENTPGVPVDVLFEANLL